MGVERENKRAGEKLEARDRESYALLRQMSGRWCAHSVPGSQERSCNRQIHGCADTRKDSQLSTKVGSASGTSRCGLEPQSHITQTHALGSLWPALRRL